MRNPGEAEHGDGGGGGCGRKHPPPAPPELPGIPRFSQQELGVGRGLGLAALAHALVSEQPVRAGEALRGQGGGRHFWGWGRRCESQEFPWEFSREYLHAALALVRLLPTVHPLVPLQVVLLDEAHVAHVALKGLLPWNSERELASGRGAGISVGVGRFINQGSLPVWMRMCRLRW